VHILAASNHLAKFLVTPEKAERPLPWPLLFEEEKEESIIYKKLSRIETRIIKINQIEFNLK